MSEPNTEHLGRASFAEWFPFGPAPFVIFAVTILSGVLILFAPAVGLDVQTRHDGDVTMWTFPPTHTDAYRAIAPSFEKKRDVTVGISQISGQVLARKFHAAAQADLKLPDLIEAENTWAASLFRGSPQHIPFVDVMPLLESEVDARGRSLYDRMVKNRFALYRHKGTQYGIPHDVHPVLLAYRKDIFDARRDEVLAETGIDVREGIATWDAFVQVGRVLADPDKGRYMIAFDDNGAATFEPLFYQMGGDFFDAEGNLTMDSEIAVKLITWLIPLVRDEQQRIAYHSQWGSQFYQKVAAGTILTFICPDWRCGNVEHNLGDLGGKLALMPLPAWKPGGRQTTTWGGTMLGITKQKHLDEPQRQKQLDLTWAFAKKIYFDKELLKQQMVRTKILPPFKDAWDPDVLDRPDPYWSDQPVLRLYADVADEVPARNGHPFLELAKTKVGEVMTDAATYYSNRGADGFEDYVRRSLKTRADYVRAKMQRNPF